MSTWIALVRALNVGTANRVAMSALREMFEAQGFTDPQTLIVSGNIVFGATSRTGAAIERTLESAMQKHFGLALDYVVRSPAEWEKLIAEVPLADVAKRDPARLIVMCLKGAPGAGEVAALQKSIRGREVIRARGAQLYIHYPDGSGQSKLTLSVIEKALGVRGTGRNWNTVLKLQALVRERA